MDKIAVLIPCYNEEKTIGKVIDDFKTALPEAVVYVYDNNSTDKTSDVAEEHGAVVRKEYRQGKGNVVRTMFRDIDAECYIMIDGDDTYPADKAKEMCSAVMEEGVDMVIGDRLSATYFIENDRRFHNFGNRFVRSLINNIFNSDVKDIMTGYRAFSRMFVKNIPILANGFEIETEMTIHALDKNYIIKEIPIDYRRRPEGSFSKLNTISDGYKVVKTVFQLFRDYKPYIFFTSISVVLGVIAVLFMLPVIIEYWHTGLVPRFPTLIVCCFVMLLAILLFISGVILEVMTKKHRQLYELLVIRKRKSE
ncbi:MAG: glycosyltransferase family 2 protein [Prevotella sp.]|nr:glycosyltransferase family 2 protein [Prevotella sp.]